jgi:putative membrane protein
MNRRRILLSAAVVPLFAQTIIARAVALPDMGTEPLSLSQYKRMSLMVGSLSLQMSHVAADRTLNERIKQFAGFEVAEQTTLAQVLTDDTSPTLTPLSPPLASSLQELQAISAGPNFDHAYVMGQIQGHQQFFTIQQRFLNSQNNNSTDSVHVAMLTRTAIQAHLTMLQDILNQMQV